MAETRLFTQRELILLTQTHADIQIGVHEVKHKRERGWELRIPFQDKNKRELQHMTLVTARGSIRIFKNLDTVIDYVKEHCSDVQSFGVYLMESIKTTRPNKPARLKPTRNVTPAKDKKRKIKKTVGTSKK